MEYIAYAAFSGRALCGNINIPKGAKLEERNNYLYYFNNKICSSTSEIAWEYFHKNTSEEAEKFLLINNLYNYILSGGEIEYDEEWLNKNTNHYWKNLIRTMSLDRLKETCKKYLGGQIHV